MPLHIHQIRIGLTYTPGPNSHGKIFESQGFPALTSKHLQTTFVQGVAFPQLESMLCSVAVRLALEKGMHRRPNMGWNLSDAEVAERNRVFWALYFLDKTIALRSGRPSVSSHHWPRKTPQANSPK
jgi:Fungal specific transcription factor domain